MDHSLDASTALAAANVRVRAARGDRSTRLLRASATAWFAVAVIGQLVFVVFVLGFYGRAALSGNLDIWNKVLVHGYVPGDTVGNAILASHLAFASVITLGGAVQLISGTRRRFPRLHRWNGRLYVAAAFVMALGGLAMIASRGGVGGPSQSVAIVLSALLIMAAALMAVREARARRFDAHRRWAWRLFLLVSGGWFFRIGLMFWIVVNRGPLWFDPKTFTGPFLTFLAFAEYAIPLALFELYVRVAARGGDAARRATAATLAAGTLVTAAGIVAATLIMWLPHL
jgi:hypothetical protein